MVRQRQRAARLVQTGNGRVELDRNRDTFRDRQEDAWATALGWFSIGLGLAEVAAPGAVAKAVGLREHDELLPAFGLREIATGVGVLTNDRPAEWLWGRVVGDVMDLAYLGNALFTPKTAKGRVLVAAAAVLGVTALDFLVAQRLSSRPARANLPKPAKPDIHVHATITVNASPRTLYEQWRKVENLPHIMRHLRSVTTLDETRSRWEATAPAGTTVTWDAEIVEDVPNQRIAWRSLEGATVTNSGAVSFRPATGHRGTVIDVELRYDPPAGAFGAAVAFLTGQEPRQQITEDLRAYKAFVETGEVPTTAGQPSGR